MLNKISKLRATVLNGSYAVGGNGGVNDFDITDKLTKYPFVGNVTLQLVWAKTAGSSTLDVILMASLDGGTTYTTLLAFTQCDGTSGSEIKQIALPAGALIKTDINLGSGSTYTAKVYVCGNVQGGAGYVAAA